MYPGQKRFGTWAVPAQTQNSGTAIVQGIAPFRGAGGSAPLLYQAPLNADGRYKPNWFQQPITKVTNAKLTVGSTEHVWYVLRPKNWTLVAEAVTKNDTTVVMLDNPGLYATKYKYPLPGSVTAPGMVADNAPASGDYFALQLDNGCWHFSVISGLSTLTITMSTGTPNVDGSTAAVGNVLFFFAAAADVDPATGLVDPTMRPVASATTDFYNDNGLVCGLHPGDPLILYNANGTNASTMAALSGAYDNN